MTAKVQPQEAKDDKIGPPLELPDYATKGGGHPEAKKGRGVIKTIWRTCALNCSTVQQYYICATLQLFNSGAKGIYFPTF